MKIDRINQIKELLQENNTISIDDLCSIFDVSKNTIRRDIAILDKEDIIEKVYGGIMLKEHKGEPEPFTLREGKHTRAKKIVARQAARLVNDGDVIFIDSGTTTMHLLPYLANIKNLTILTTSLYVINEALNYPHFNLICTGGTLYYPSKAFVGTSVLNCLDKYNVSKSFMSSTGISIENGVTNTSPLESETKKIMMSKGAPKILLIDSSKIGISALMTYAGLKNFDIIVLNEAPSKRYIEYFQSNRIELIYPGK